MNKALFESRLKMLNCFCENMCIDLAESNIINFIKAYEAKQLTKSKIRVKDAKKSLIVYMNADIFAEINAKMQADKISKSELARRLGRTPQQVGKILKSGNATLKTINNIKQAINYGNSTL